MVCTVTFSRTRMCQAVVQALCLQDSSANHSAWNSDIWCTVATISELDRTIGLWYHLDGFNIVATGSSGRKKIGYYGLNLIWSVYSRDDSLSGWVSSQNYKKRPSLLCRSTSKFSRCYEQLSNLWYNSTYCDMQRCSSLWTSTLDSEYGGHEDGAEDGACDDIFDLAPAFHGSSSIVGLRQSCWIWM